MNVPEIRQALERLYEEESPVERAVVRVGLRACDEWERPCLCDGNASECNQQIVTARLAVIADILREAGVEVER